MSDYISRDAAFKEFAEFVRGSNNSDFVDAPTWNDAVSLIGSLPAADVVSWEQLKKAWAIATADVAPVVHGEWIDYIGRDLGIEGQWLRDDGKTVFIQCDKCDSLFVRNLMIHPNYCPNCGAKMDGGTNDESD